ncbi:hypothetical protein FRC07_010447, partial [Ceratobasidium sp. 392]
MRQTPDRPKEFPTFSSSEANMLWNNILECWAYNPSDRPQSDVVKHQLEDVKLRIAHTSLQSASPEQIDGGCNQGTKPNEINASNLTGYAKYGGWASTVCPYALIIAVNGEGLGAPESDAARLHKALASIGVAPIHTLTGRSATRQNIIQSLNNIADNPRIKKDTPILIYFAGHGTRQEIEIPGVGRRMVGCIMPVDSLSNQAPPIPTVTISALLSRIARKKSRYITLLYDASGTDHGMGFGAFNKDISTHPQSFRYSSVTSHVLIASCHESQVSLEYTARGAAYPQGLFTTALIDALAECAEDKVLCTVTHVALFTRIKEIMQDIQLSTQSALRYPQIPRCEGYNKHRPVFSTPSLPHGRHAIAPLVSDPDHGTCLIPIGLLAGVRPQTAFEIYDYPNGKLRLMGRYRVAAAADIFENRTRLNTGRQLQLLPEAYAVMCIPPTALPVEMTGSFPALYSDRSFQSDLASRLGTQESLDYFIVPARSGHTYKVRASRSTARGPIELRNAYGVPLKIRNPKCVPDALAKAITFFHHLDQPNLSPVHDPNMLSVVIHALTPVQTKDWSAIDHVEVLVPTRSLPPIAMHPTNGCTISGSNSEFGLQIVNRGAYPFFVYVFYFDPNDYSIAPLYLPPTSDVAPLAVRGELTVGYGDFGASPLSFSIDDHLDKDTGFIKVYYSTVPSEMSFIQQEGFKEDPDPRSGGTSRLFESDQPGESDNFGVENSARERLPEATFISPTITSSDSLVPPATETERLGPRPPFGSFV